MPSSRLAVLLALLVPLSGCLGASTPGATSDPVEPAAGEPVPARALHNATGLIPLENATGILDALPNLTTSWRSVDGRDAREPTVGVDSTGAIYYAARDYSGGNVPPVSSSQTPIMKSTDGGLTWEDVSPRLPTGDREPPRSGDPMVWVDPWTDRIFQIELYDLVCNWLVYSDDGGDSWTGNAKACGSLVVDHQTIAAGPTRSPLTQTVGYPNVVYVCVNQIADSHCARSLDGGLTFGTFHLVFPGVQGGCFAGGLHGHVLVDAEGRVYLPREFCGRPYVAVSEDDGLTWDLVDVTGATGGPGAIGQDPNMAFDAAGNVHYLWIGDDQLPYVAWSSDGGKTWSDAVRVSPPHVTAANLPSITAGDDGRIGIAYVATSQTQAPPVDNEDWDNVTWDAYVSVSHDATSADPTFLTTSANPNGDPVYRGDCTNRRCGYLREFIDASIAPDGSFYAAFVDGCLDECDTTKDDYGQGNGHLGYVVHVADASLRAVPPADAH